VEVVLIFKRECGDIGRNSRNRNRRNLRSIEDRAPRMSDPVYARKITRGYLTDEGNGFALEQIRLDRPLVRGIRVIAGAYGVGVINSLVIVPLNSFEQISQNVGISRTQ
jgi:hypothetical protein